MAAGALTPSCSCRDGADLVGEDRELPDLVVDGETFTVRATLAGRYGRVRAGGGRMTYSRTTSEETWTTRLVVESQDPELELTSYGEVTNVDFERELPAGRLASFTLEQCPGPERDVLVFRVRGMFDHGWRVLYRLDAEAVTGALDFDAETCAEAASRAPRFADFLRGVWHEGVRAWADLAALREGRPGAGMNVDMSQRKRSADQACGRLLGLGEAREAVRCALALRFMLTQPAGRDIAEAIAAGSSRGVDVEEALFELAAPGAMPSFDDAAMQSVATQHSQGRLREYLAAASTGERRGAFFDAHIEGCGVAPASCEPWLLGALLDVARSEEGSPRCARMRALAHEALPEANGDRAEGCELPELEAWLRARER